MISCSAAAVRLLARLSAEYNGKESAAYSVNPSPAMNMEQSFFSDNTLSGRLVTGQDCPHPRPVVSGNGTLVTSFGPSGYHTGEPNPGMQVFCLAGRRLKGPTAPLVRYGQVTRSVLVDGEPSEPSRFQQELRPREGLVLSRLEHARLTERTVSFVCLGENSAAFQTTLTNTGGARIEAELRVCYRFGDWAGEIAPGTLIFTEELPALNGMRLRFQIEDEHLGAADLLSDRPVEMSAGERSVTLVWRCDLAPGEHATVSFLWGIGDKRAFRYTPAQWSFEDLLARQKEQWGEFFGRSSVQVGDADVETLRDVCLYSLRCNSTPWSIPPLVSPSQWDGRTFHDELYPFLGLASSGSLDLAGKIPLYRLHTLGKALERSVFRGAKFAWESLEDGRDGSPYGPWLEEHFHMGQFAEAAWQFCLHDGRPGTLRQFYPLISEIARYYELNLVRFDGEKAYVRECTDYDEAIFPVANGMYTACAAIRSLELAARAARLLGEPEGTWDETARKLRANLPCLEAEGRYLTAAGARHRHIAEAGPVFPFRIDPGSEMAARTLDSFCEAVRTEAGLQPGNLPNYGGRRWLWTASHVATAYSLIYQPEKAWAILQEAPRATGPALTPTESVGQGGDLALPFFTTSSGAFVFSLSSLFVQISDGGVTVLPPLPAQLANASYRGIAGAGGLVFSGRFEDGRAAGLTIRAEQDGPAEVLVHRSLLPDGFGGWDSVQDAAEDGAFWRVRLALGQGDNVWRGA